MNQVPNDEEGVIASHITFVKTTKYVGIILTLTLRYASRTYIILYYTDFSLPLPEFNTIFASQI